MPIFEAGEILRVPFPYTDRPVRQRRPALVVSRGRIGPDARLVWVAMITSAANAGWPDDVAIDEDAAITGLPIPSLIRPAKLATIKAGDVEAIGCVATATVAAVAAAIRRRLA